MPIGAYFKGHGSEVMSDMTSRYGDKKGTSVFYATAAKRGLKPMAAGGVAAPEEFDEFGNPIPPQGPPPPPPRPPMRRDAFDAQPDAAPPQPMVGPPQPAMMQQGPPIPRAVQDIPEAPMPMPGPPRPPQYSMQYDQAPDPETQGEAGAAIAPPPVNRQYSVQPEQDASPPQGPQQPTRTPIGQDPMQQRYRQAQDKVWQKAQEKSPWWKTAAAAALSVSPRTAGIGHAILHPPDKLEEAMPQLQAGAKYAEQEQQAQSGEELKREQIGAQKEARLASAAQRLAAIKPNPMPADRLAELDAHPIPGLSTEQKLEWIMNGKLAEAKPLTSLAPGHSVPDGKGGWTVPVAAPPSLMPVSPGTHVIDRNKPGAGAVYTAPDKPIPDRNPQRLQLEADALDKSDPEKSARAQAILQADEQRSARITRAGADARRDANNTPSAPITPGTREFKVAQDLAYGRLTLQQFRSLSAYSRDTNKKMDIYQKAGELNPNFNPSSFEMGFTLAKNPKVQQQLAAMDNVQAGIPSLLQHSNDAARSGITLLNKVIVPGGIALGGKTYSNLHAARLGFADELSGALGFGSATDMSRQMGLDMTNPNLSPANFASAIKDVVEPFVQRKRSTLLKQMGIYGEAGMNPAAGPSQPGPPLQASPAAQGGAVSKDPLGIR